MVRILDKRNEPIRNIYNLRIDNEPTRDGYYQRFLHVEADVSDQLIKEIAEAYAATMDEYERYRCTGDYEIGVELESGIRIPVTMRVVRGAASSYML